MTEQKGPTVQEVLPTGSQQDTVSSARWTVPVAAFDRSACRFDATAFAKHYGHRDVQLHVQACPVAPNRVQLVGLHVQLQVHWTGSLPATGYVLLLMRCTARYPAETPQVGVVACMPLILCR